MELNARLQANGLDLLAQVEAESIPAAFFDPQYRGVLDKLSYGNEGQSRGKARCALAQMDDETIRLFAEGIERALRPSGHLFFWMDKFSLLSGFRQWLPERLHVVDMITWDKCRIGMGYRSRRASEHCVIAQKHPKRAKGFWKDRRLADVWRERPPPKSTHPHAKPILLQARLIEAVTEPGDVVLDPCAGGFTSFHAAQISGRSFLGCDLKG